MVVEDQHHQISPECHHQGVLRAYTDGVYQHKFEWFITDNKCIKQFVNGYTFAEFA